MAQSQKLAVNNARYGKTSNGTASTRAPFKHLSKNIALELPPPGANRWTARSKAAVVTAIRAGVLTLDDACLRYELSPAEYQSWESGFDKLGLEGLGLAGRQLRRRAQAYAGK